LIVAVGVDSSVFVAGVKIVPAGLWIETCVSKFSPDVCAAAMAASAKQVILAAFLSCISLR
jgi:hypothetical protein